MDFVINKIVDIEKEAQHITDEAENAKNNLDNDIENELIKIEEKLKRNLEEKVKSVMEKELNVEKQKIEELENLHKEKLLSFKNEFSKNSEQWCNQIFQSIIKSADNQ